MQMQQSPSSVKQLVGLFSYCPCSIAWIVLHMTDDEMIARDIMAEFEFLLLRCKTLRTENMLCCR